MEKYWNIITNSYRNFGNYLLNEVTLNYTYKPLWQNYFYLLIAISLLFFILEIVLPWRKKQAVFRKDFWMDAFYMFFNFFLFGLIVFSAASEVVVNLFTDGLALIGITNLVAIEVQQLPVWAHLLIGFVVKDFVQWWVHRLLHRVDFLWEFHKVHHSVEEMGFAAHLRYHWMENVVYSTLQYVPLALIGIGLNDFFVINIFALIVGHHNHSNLHLPEWAKGLGFGALIGIFIAFIAVKTSLTGGLLIIGITMLVGVAISPLIKYIFNSPEMHIWHHAYHLPEERKYGVNFGLTLSCWDYLFRTDYIPHSGKDIKLGFPGKEEFPEDFLHQVSYLGKKKID